MELLHKHEIDPAWLDFPLCILQQSTKHVLRAVHELHCPTIVPAALQTLFNVLDTTDLLSKLQVLLEQHYVKLFAPISYICMYVGVL
jgi:hypothetical protein